MKIVLVALFSVSLVSSVVAQNPESVCSCATVTLVANANPNAVRIDHDPADSSLYYQTINGDIFQIRPPYLGQAPELKYSAADHGNSSNVLGFAIGPNGDMYVVGNRNSGDNTIATIARGVKDGSGGRDWSVFLETEPYPRSATPFDHFFNGVVVSPDSQFVFVNSGSRTDHGEEQDNSGAFPGEREVPLTSSIFRIPTDTSNVVLPNNADSLISRGFLFAEGFRNSFDLAFHPDGYLFATENSGDRDDNEELNWVREGGHYGFPWRMGMNDTPQQFTPYDPSADLLINSASFSASNGFFYNDPDYPEPPAGIEFLDGVINKGPDAAYFRDASNGLILDAARGGLDLSTFTPHRSPLGLVFFEEEILDFGFTRGDGFVLSWTGNESNLLSPFGDDGEDLISLKFNQVADNFEIASEIIVTGFDNPIDATMIGRSIFVIEWGGGRQIWKVEIVGSTSIADEIPEDESGRINVYPNPAIASVTMDISGVQPGPYRIQVYDMLGREVLEEEHFSDGSTAKLLMDVTGLSNGHYVIRAESGGRLIARRFVVLQ